MENLDPNKYYNPVNPAAFQTAGANVSYREFSFQVLAANDVIQSSYEMPKNAKQLIGIQVFADLVDQARLRGKTGFRLNERELFPNDFSARNLMTTVNAPAMLRFYPVLNHPREIGDRLLKYVYTDTNHPTQVFAPYTVFVSLMIAE